MRKNTTNFVLDLGSFLLLLGLTATGLIMKFVLPPGSGGRTLWGLGRHGWGDVHFWIAAGMVVLIVAHMALHWTWTTTTVRRLVTGQGRCGRGRRDAAWGWGALVVVVVALGSLVAVGRSAVVAPPEGAGDSHGEHEVHDVQALERSG